MDFSAFNPQSSNSLNLAARNNEVLTVERLLKKNSPNCVDNRGWTCLHEAAANDSYDCLILILKHPEIRTLAETYEGHTALYLACEKKCSIRTIKALLGHVDDIANYCSTEMVSPLHVVSGQGRIEVLQLLLDYGAIIDLQDFDGDTPLHDAAFATQYEAVIELLHAGAQAEKKNVSYYTPLHLACLNGCLEIVRALHPFVTDINERTEDEETPLILATRNGSIGVVQYLLDNGADPHLKNIAGEIALHVALTHGNSDVFKILLEVTDRDKIDKNILILACKPHYFNMDIIITLLESDLSSEFFNQTEEFYVTLEKIGNIRPVYLKNAPLNSFLHISEYIYKQSEELFRKLFYLFLMKGVAVDALYIDECPPLVYVHYCEHSQCYEDIFEILFQQGCNVDYCSASHIPDAIIASIATGGSTTPILLQFSLACEPGDMLRFVCNSDIADRIPQNIQRRLLTMAGVTADGHRSENLPFLVPELKHLCRLRIRASLRNSGLKSTEQFLKALHEIPLPPVLRNYLRYS